MEVPTASRFTVDWLDCAELACSGRLGVSGMPGASRVLLLASFVGTTHEHRAAQAPSAVRLTPVCATWLASWVRVRRHCGSACSKVLAPFDATARRYDADVLAAAGVTDVVSLVSDEELKRRRRAAARAPFATS